MAPKRKAEKELVTCEGDAGKIQALIARAKAKLDRKEPPSTPSTGTPGTASPTSTCTSSKAAAQPTAKSSFPKQSAGKKPPSTPVAKAPTEAGPTHRVCTKAASQQSLDPEVPVPPSPADIKAL